ncbi:hypothetical protein [Methylobacterium sp. R2-1]|uniref:hypothetical protein n=1 Tax=Methylobacterium sp. R2-1 TaxID=2587064 RepID=UPI00160B4DFC|nr:hypothetical protein [Methylobacterium sp. R2-1]MBB2959905.1 hypothetical protein [Methylobacterium sp. R2-1]
MDRPIIFSAPMVRALLAGRKTQTRRILKPQPPTPEQFRGSTFSLDRAVADGVKVYSLNDLDRLPKHPTKWDLCGSVGVARNAGFPTTYRVPFTVGDRLWVRENHQFRGASYNDGTESEPNWSNEEWFRCWGSGGAGDCWDPDFPDGWSPSRHMGVHDLTGPEHDEGEAVRGLATKILPSIHMPRWASRLTLLVTEVRVERLNAISEADAIAEGMPDFGSFCESLDPGTLNAAGETASETASRLRWPQRWFASLWNSINGADAWSANPWVVAVSFQPFETNIDRMPERQAPVAIPAAAAE